MISYTRSALGLLCRQYRSVLKKCFLINAGIFGMVMPIHAEYANINEAVADITTPREYVLTANENVNTDLGTMGGTDAILTIDGSSAKYGINGDNVSGLVVDAGNTLVLKNLGSLTISGDGKSASDYVISSSVNGFVSTGGSFVNNAGTLTVSDVVFKSDSATKSAGAIGNTGTITEISNATFYGNNSKFGAGITNNSGGVIGNISANFVANEGSPDHSYGASIFNSANSEIGDIAGKFIANKIDVEYYGGGVAIYNNSSSVGNVTADFVNNNVSAGQIMGSVIFSDRGSKMGNISGEFSNNSAISESFVLGGIINNGCTGYSEMGDISADFKNNTIVAKNGWYIIGAMIENGEGQRIEGSDLGNISGVFENNTATADYGVFGAIYNDKYATIKDITSDFKNNTLTADTIYGFITNNSGGIINKIEGSVFENNTANGKSLALGTAITNTGEITEGLVNTKFLDNKAISDAAAQGGAVYTSKDLRIIADGAKGDGTSTFKGNYVQIGGAEKKYEAIYVSDASETLTFESKNGGTINMYDYVTGTDGFKTDITGDGSGVMNLFNDIKNSDVNVSNTTVNIDNNNVNVKNITFAADSTLVLSVNSLTDHGVLTAENMTIANGATLKATLAQGIVKINQSATVQLLNADNADFNNFTDSFDNNVYHFEKANKNGLYRITPMKTAEDVVQEAGAHEWVSTAAHDYVDIGNFASGTIAADIADELSYLAQNDASALIKEIKALAPTEASTVQTNIKGNASRLFKTVDNYLRGEREPFGVSSGDEAKGVSIWAKPYVGTAKVNSKADVSGYDSDSKGVIAGLEKKIGKDWKLGIGLQYDETDMNAVSRDIDISSTAGFVYGEFKPNRWFVNAAASYGVSDYDEDKHVLGTKYAANYDVSALSFASVTGYQFDYITPELGMRYYRIKQGEYTDGAQQHVGKTTAEIWRAVAGVRFAKDFGNFRPDVYLGITYDAKNGKKRTPVSLANGTSYIVPGERLKSFGYETSVGFIYSLNDYVKLGATYMGAYKEKYQEHTAMLKLRYEF